MMGRLQRHFILFVGALLMVLASVHACVDSVIVFGDSQFDSGNNALVKNCTTQANFPPYGSSFFKKPTGRFTNGRTVADFIAQYLGIKFQKPYQEVYQELTKGSLKNFPANGINFASGGSGVLPHTNKHDGVTTIESQLQQFQGLIDKKHLEKQQLDKSLFFLESGSNDIVNYFLSPGTSNMTSKAYVDIMLKEVDLFIDTIHKFGARKIVIFSVGPMGCVPAIIAVKGALVDQCFDKMNDMSKDYNVGLELRANNISKRYPDAVGVYGIIYDTVQKFRADPKPNGFTNVNEACCGGGPLNGILQCGLKGYKMCTVPNEFFFWDFIHPTERAYELLSKELWSGGKDKIRPVNLQTLACKNTSALS